MANKSIDDQIRDHEEKLADLKKRKKQQEKRNKSAERTRRNHRLIQYGALVEKYFDCKDLESVEKFEAMLDWLANYEVGYQEALSRAKEHAMKVTALAALPAKVQEDEAESV